VAEAEAEDAKQVTHCISHFKATYLYIKIYLYWPLMLLLLLLLVVVCPLWL